MESPGPIIAIENVSKHFGPMLAVDSVTLSISRGEFFSLLGPSGCGKTTLLRMIGGFAFPDEGRVRLDGEDVTDLPPNRRPTNMVFQSYAIFPHLNVRDNIAYGLRTERISSGEMNVRIEAALAMIKLAGYGDRRAHQLSGGERQRVALARALVKRPKVLLLDEPLGALDKRLRESMQIELRQLQRDVAITFVFVTHDQEEALSMSDRVAVMEKGRVLQVAAPKALYEAPNSQAVAEFIGTMNFFDGRILGTMGAALVIESVALGKVAAPMPSRAGPQFSLGQRVLVAIRPENLAIAAKASPGTSVPCRIVSATYLGDRSQIHVAIQKRDTLVTVASQRSGPQIDGPGAELHLSWSPEALIVLPAE